MKIKSLTLQNFRNIACEKIEWEDGINVLTGKNAQGKTNILEAIHFCSFLKSFRAVREEQLIRFGEQSARILLEYEAGGERNTIEIKIQKDGPKELKRNGLTVFKNREIIGAFLSVLFTPDHLNLIKEGPQKRRSFLDMALCAVNVKYTDALLKYQKILLQKNALLKRASMLGADPALLDIYDRRLSEEGAYIGYCRAKYIEQLEPYAKQIFYEISGNSGALKLLYINQFVKTAESEEQLQEEMQKRFLRKRRTDIEAGFTSNGVQKDDLLLLNNGKSLKYFGSQGQIRSAVIALILAQGRVINDLAGVTPVVLLDDILSELDRTRRKYVLDDIKDAQCILTTCETQKVMHLKHKVMKVSGGKIL